jgi:ubiquinone/menaquinone biosynthesis C-methylase UbiE
MDNNIARDIYPGWVRVLFWPLRLFFYLLYHQMAWMYDWVAGVVSLGSWQKWVLSVMPYLQGTCILELGHGPGHLQKALWEKLNPPGVIFGLDASPQMIRIAGHRLKRSGYSPNLVNGTAQNLPYPEGIFQSVAATFPTQYIFDPSSLAEIYRVLTPGGRLVVLTTALITGRGLQEKTAAWLFKITGQSTPMERHLLEPARRAGFHVKVQPIKLKSSILMLLIAEKE